MNGGPMKAPALPPRENLVSDKPTAILQRSMITLGFGLYLSWQMLFMNQSLLEGAAQGHTPGFLYPIQEGLFLATLIALAVLGFRKGKIPLSRQAFWLFAVLLCIGTLFQYRLGGLANDSLFAYAGYVSYGVRAVLLALWGEMLCTVRPSDSLFCIAGAYAISLGMNLVGAYLSAPAIFLFHAVLPPLSALVYASLCDTAPLTASAPSRQLTAKLPANLFVGIGLFGFVMQLLFNFSEARVSVPDEFVTVVSGLVVSIGFAVFARFRRRELNFTRLYRIITPTIILIALGIALSQANHQSYEAFFIGAVWTFYKIFSWALWRSIGYHSSVPSVVVFSIGYIALDVFTYLPTYAFGLTPFSSDHFAKMAIIILVSLGISIFLLREEHISSITATGKRQSTGSSNSADTTQRFAGYVRQAAEEYRLTEREQEVALLILHGKDNADIVQTLFITKNTLRTHLHNIYEKTDVHSRQALIDLLLEQDG